MENLIKIQESFEELTREVDKFRSMTQLAEKNERSISEMGGQLTRVIANFEKYRNLLDGRIQVQSIAIDGVLHELKNTKQTLDSALGKFDVILGRSLKSILSASETLQSENTNTIIRAFNRGNDLNTNELVSILSSLEELNARFEKTNETISNMSEDLASRIERTNRKLRRSSILIWILAILSFFAIVLESLKYFGSSQ